MSYVIGVGKTKFGKINKSLPELAYEAMVATVTDAGISVEEVGAIFVGNFGAGLFNGQLHLGAMVASLLPGMTIPVIRMEAACASGGAALFSGVMALKKYKKVLVLGLEKMNQSSSFENSKSISLAGDYLYDYGEGLLFPAAYALMAQAHMKKYGSSLDDLARVSLKNHKNANLNPKAHFYEKKVNMEMIKSSVVVASPLRLFDCSPISDGAAAVVLSLEREGKRSVKILASSLVASYLSLSQAKSLVSIESTRLVAKQAYKQAGIGPKKVDLAEVHDCFTIAELLAMEDLGFYEPGEAKELIRKGETKLSGSLPINTGGGLKGGGHPLGATGVSQVIEVVNQLRGEAGKRQVKKARVGLTHNVGGTGGTCVIHILAKN